MASRDRHNDHQVVQSAGNHPLLSPDDVSGSSPAHPRAFTHDADLSHENIPRQNNGVNIGGRHERLSHDHALNKDHRRPSSTTSQEGVKRVSEDPRDESSTQQPEKQPQQQKQGDVAPENSYISTRRTWPKDHSSRAKLDPHYQRVQKQKRDSKSSIGRFNKWRDEWFQRWIMGFLLRQFPLPPTRDGRHIPITFGDARKVAFHDERRGGKAYTSNLIRSNRYTLWSFLPKQLYFQFSKLGNFYFLVVGSVQLIPTLSTTGSYTTILPLMVFVALSMAKEGWDDYHRYQLDKSENRSLVWVLDTTDHCDPANRNRGQLERLKRRKGTHNEKHSERDRANMQTGGPALELYQADVWVGLQWQDVRVGDILRLDRDSGVPADLVLLHATNQNNIAYVDTAVLDGETSLKSRQVCSLLTERCGASITGLQTSNATVISEDPDSDLYKFDGRVVVDGDAVPLTLNNVMFRGSVIRNTTGVIGMVIKTGEECKIRMNANKDAQTKRPAMQGIVNRIIVIFIVAVLLLAGGFTIGYHIWKDYYIPIGWYLIDADLEDSEIILAYIIMFYSLIPLSLYISMECIKVGQSILLRDIEMFDPETDTPMTANTTTILENLGQIRYVFSDKTGTLTENKMRLRKFTVGGTAWHHNMDLRKKTDQHLSGGGLMEKSENADMTAVSVERVEPGLNDSHGSPPEPPDTHDGGLTPERELNTDNLAAYLHNNQDSVYTKMARHFLLCIALCHTALPEFKGNGEVEFQASSPDELALVQAARELGYALTDRDGQTIVLEIKNSDNTISTERYNILDVIEFSSKRMRMSVIIGMPGGRMCIISKGADSTILPRLRQSTLAVRKFAEAGRRASKGRRYQGPPPVQEQYGINGKRSVANKESAIVDEALSITGPARGDNVRKTPGNSSATRLEGPDKFLGHDIDESVAADEGAVFDRCFQQVDDFASDGLRILLYGYRYIDKQEYDTWKETYKSATTSLVNRQEQIEAAGELIEHDLELAGVTAIEDKLQAGVPETIDKLRRANIRVWMLTGDNRETAINIAYSAGICQLSSKLYVLDILEGDIKERILMVLEDIIQEDKNSVLVIDGKTLGAIEQDSSLGVMFSDLARKIDSVICCRALPSQKAALVKRVRDIDSQSVTLAIGDGANDIAMIQASHVGIGISGREGLQAARVSDFSIAQFRFLQRLLFVHGRWNYQRTGKYILATFWKEVLFFLCQAQYQRFNGYTGVSLFEYTILLVFTILFTSLPVIVPGIFEQELKASTLLAVPELYTYGQQNRAFNLRKYVGWMLMASIESIIIYMLIYSVYTYALYTDDNSIFAMGQCICTATVLFINIKLFILEMHYKTTVTLVNFTLSVSSWFLWICLTSISAPPSTSPYQVHAGFTQNFGRALIWWTTVLLALIAATVFELAVTALRRVYLPEDQDLLQEMEIMGTVGEEVKRNESSNT